MKFAVAMVGRAALAMSFAFVFVGNTLKAQTVPVMEMNAEQAEQSLQAVRNALVKLAMQGPTEVKNTAWIDESGALRDSSEFTNAMVVRGVRVLAYSHDESDQPSATLDLSQDSRTLDRSCPKATQALLAQDHRVQHLVVFDVGIAPQLGAQDLFQTRLIVKALREDLLAQGDVSNIFKMTMNALPSDSVALSGVSNNKATVQAVFPSAINAYQQALLGRGDQRVTWQASLFLEPSRDELSQAPGLKVNIVLRNKLDKRQMFTATEYLWFESTPLRRYSSVLSNVMSEQVHALTESIRKTFESQLSCIPPQFEVMKWNARQLQVAAGRMNGLKTGDQFVVIDPELLPEHMFQPGAMKKMVLAEVKRVNAYSAELKQLTGPDITGSTTWVAIAHNKLSDGPPSTHNLRE